MNELVVTESQLLGYLAEYLWPFIRIGALFMAVPIIGAQTVPARVRVGLAVCVAILVAPMIPERPDVPIMSLAAMVLIVHEVVVGLAMGFVMQVFLHIFVVSGQMIAMKMGLGFAAMNDPSTGVSVTVLSQFYLLLSTLLFLSVDGHLLVMRLLAESFISVPIGTGLTAADFHTIAGMGSWMFSAALVMALPIFTSVMVVNMAFGAMNRSAPQMNVFTVGFPMTLIFGLLLMWFSLITVLPNFNQFVEEGMRYLRSIVALG